MFKNVNRKTLAALAVGSMLLLAGCSQKNREPFRDAPQDGKHDRTPGKIIEMPDGFSNLSTKCVDGIRYTVVYHGDGSYGALSVIGGDNGCSKA